MEFSLLLQIAQVFWRELIQQRYKVYLLGLVISFAILGLGVTIQSHYETTITIFSDNQNVIKPLLEGQTSVTTPKNEQIRIVRELMFSQRLLEKVLQEAMNITVKKDSRKSEQLMDELRGEIKVDSPVENYIKISYVNPDPDMSYKVVNKITNLFIEESANTKREESKSAYTFIDEQVKSYKEQLLNAENKLKAFDSANVDGHEQDVAATIARLRTGIEDLEIEIESGGIRIAALQSQLQNEHRYSKADYTAVVYRDRLASLESKLAQLNLQYKDEHPDIVDLKLQIADLKNTIVEVESNKQSSEVVSAGSSPNPVYNEIANQLSTAQVELQEKQHRLSAYKLRLEEQYSRRARVANNQAEYSELTRDYSVTKEIYENLLERKEKARISMTLDLVGQGVAFKVLEPAVFPTVPTGLRYLHFVIAGPFMGLLIPVLILLIILFFDSRIRLPNQLDAEYPGILLAVVPREKTVLKDKKRMMLIIAASAFAYAGATFGLHALA